jgi:succinoglycan biosynthesis protein ExoA
MSPIRPEGPRVLIVIPTLNEAAHVGRLLDWLGPHLEALDARLVVADGGSTDGTREIVAARLPDRPRLALLPNPERLQSAGVNLAVDRFAGPGTTWLLRLDAHSEYPPDFCEALLAEGEGTGADSVVVSMTAVGRGFWQEAAALAQNSRFGNGGSAHRNASEGAWVEHGHHALMRLPAFRAVGGYDPSFSHNEDAELDLRLHAAGFRIWLTGRTGLLYHPRSTPAALARQYLRFGRGRARTMRKHGRRPGTRQAVVIALAPALLLALLAPLHWIFAAPLLLWALACLAAGLLIARGAADKASGLMAGLLAGVMQAAWSAGFWREWLGGRPA